MIALLSPAKSLNFDEQTMTEICSEPKFLDESKKLIRALRKLSPDEISSLMKVSDKLAELNHDRFKKWNTPFTTDNAKQAALAFTGDVYQGFDFTSYKAADFKQAQKSIRILSGLYGVLRPLDLMQAYRLEMGTKFSDEAGKNLYCFWKEKVTESIVRDLKKTKSTCLVNLASSEYFSVIDQDKIELPIVTPVFRDEKDGVYKIISFYAKRARGMMADYIVRSNASSPKDLKGFSVAGYMFDKASSSGDELVFLRSEQAKEVT